MKSSLGPRRAAVAFIFITVMLDMLALGMMLPVLPKLIVGFVGGDAVQASMVYGVFGTVWNLMQFLFSSVLGAASDRFGRRPIVLLSNFGLGLDYLIMAVAPNLGWLLVGRVLSGVTAASITTSFAYIADVCPPEKRAAGFGLIGAAFGLGFVLGPAVGGVLGDADPRLPFWVSAGLSLLNGLYGYFVLPESLAKENRAPFSWRQANPVGSLRLLRSHPRLLGLSAVHFFSQLAHVVLPSTFVLYGSYRYGWNPAAIGLTLAAVGGCSMIVQAGLVRWVVKRLGERPTMLLGLFLGALGFAFYGVAPTGTWFRIAVPVVALWGLAGPATQSLMTRLVGPSEQGRLQGSNSSLTGIAGLFGPMIFTSTFSFFIADARQVWHFPGAPFVLAGMLLLTALVIGWLTTANHHSPSSEPPRLVTD